MQFSNWTDLIERERGIISLMKDLGNAHAKPGQPLYMLGGGNPAKIPEIEQYFRDEMLNIMQSSNKFEKLVGNYAGPQGLYQFSEALAQLLKTTYQWEIGPENIAVANGSQMAFTILFRLFSGPFREHQRKQILLPMTPEYIGYNEADDTEPRFCSTRPKIVELSDHVFKYEIDFNAVQVDDGIGAICVSRPTNPTGNMITDGELDHLSELAKQQDIPLIIDGAYGLPFPNLVYNKSSVKWNPNIVLSLSLSKLGLPGTRTGIVIAHEQIIEQFTRANAIMTLASGNFGSVLTLDSVINGDLLRLSNTVIQPYYKSRMEHVTESIHRQMRGLPYRLHKPEGAFFVWLWFPGLPISDEELYARLKKQNVYIVPGRFFFPGLDEPWQHRNECIRVSYAGDEAAVEKGIGIIADEVRQAFAQAQSVSTN